MNNEIFIEEKKSKTPLIIVSIIVLLMIGLGTYFLVTKVFNKEEKKEEPQKQEVEKEKITPLMYEITKEGSSNKIYLFGSIHFANISKLEFPNYIMDAYKNSNYVACEFNIVKFLKEVDTETLLEDYYYVDGDSLEKHVSSKESYDKIIKFLSDSFKLQEAQAKILTLSTIDSLITEYIIPKSDIKTAQEGVDTYFLNKATEDNKTILEVESYEFQSNLEKSFPDRVMEIEIIDAIDNMEDGINDLNELYKYWKEGNEEKLIELLTKIDEDDYSKEDLVLIKDYNKKMLDDRNIGMKNKLEEYFNNNYTVFYMVGAAHLLGDNGIAKLLENDGYTVKIVK